MNPYEPREGSIPDKVLGWLEINGGTLTVQEIAQHFDTPASEVPKALRMALAHGLIRRRSSLRGVYYELVER